MVLRLSCHWGQQRQQHQSWIHDEEISPSAALLHICLSLYSSKPFVVQMFCIQEWCVICCWQDKSTSRPRVILRWTLRQSFHKVLVQMKVYLKRQRCNPLENAPSKYGGWNHLKYLMSYFFQMFNSFCLKVWQQLSKNWAVQQVCINIVLKIMKNYTNCWYDVFFLTARNWIKRPFAIQLFQKKHLVLKIKAKQTNKYKTANF